ncbi:MAG: hypothetical protein L0H94_06060 [Nitrospira sp.]|nr:hypothetical protein [Nitrospira sp.]
MHRQLIIIGVVLLYFAAPALGAIIQVSDGCTIEDAINAANTDSGQGGCPQGSGSDTIVLPAGKFPISQGQEITGDMRFIGQGQDNTIIDGQAEMGKSTYFIKVVRGTVSLSGLTIEGFKVPQDGFLAPLDVDEGSSLHLFDVTIRANDASVGAILIRGYVSVVESNIRLNIASHATIYVAPTGHLFLTRSAVVENSSRPARAHVVVKKDYATLYGDGTMQIRRSTISTNNIPRIRDVGGHGVGGIIANSSVQIFSSTIVFNQGRLTGGIRSLSGAEVTLQNSILAKNLRTDLSISNCAGTLNSGDYNILDTALGFAEPCTIVGLTSHNIMEDPRLEDLLRPLGSNTVMHRPQFFDDDPAFSPAINGGPPDPPDIIDGDACPFLDQRLLRRIDRCDIGAVEVGTALLVYNRAGNQPGDNHMKLHLHVDLAFKVFDDTLVGTPDTAGKNLVIILESAPSAVAGQRFRNVPVPVLVIKPGAFDEMSMTGANPDDFGVSPNQTSVWIKTKRRMTADLIGTVPTTFFPQRYAFGRKLAPGAKCLARAHETSTRCMIFRIGAGKLLSNGMPAPARRVGFFAVGNTYRDVTSEGERLFLGAVLWAAR